MTRPSRVFNLDLVTSRQNLVVFSQFSMSREHLHAMLTRYIKPLRHAG